VWLVLRISFGKSGRVGALVPANVQIAWTADADGFLFLLIVTPFRLQTAAPMNRLLSALLRCLKYPPKASAMAACPLVTSDYVMVSNRDAQRVRALAEFQGPDQGPPLATAEAAAHCRQAIKTVRPLAVGGHPLQPTSA